MKFFQKFPHCQVAFAKKNVSAELFHTRRKQSMVTYNLAVHASRKTEPFGQNAPGDNATK